MESLNIGHTNYAFDQRDLVPGHLCQVSSQKAITMIKHRMGVQKVLDVIENRLDDPPTLAELALLAGLSRTYFSQVFKEVTGIGLQDYIFRARIHKAKYLLGDINLTIKQVAFKVGFKDPDHFSRTFKRLTGITPTDWKLKKMEDSLLKVSLMKTK